MMRATRAIAVLHDDDHSSSDHDLTINVAMSQLHLISTIKKPIVVNLESSLFTLFYNKVWLKVFVFG